MDHKNSSSFRLSERRRFYDLKWEQIQRESDKSIEETDSVHEEANQIKSSGESRSFLPRAAPKASETIVGLEEGLIEMKGRIFGEPSELQIIPIVGMGGIGKTTLASLLSRRLRDRRLKTYQTVGSGRISYIR